MKIQYAVVGVFLIATSAILGHCTPTSEPDLFQDQDAFERLKVMYQNVQIMQQTRSERNVNLDDFKVGYEIALHIVAPYTGLFALNMYDDNDNIVLHIVARYNWIGERNVLVLNAFQGGRWGPEVRPGGFDFQPGISMMVNVVAASDGFHVFQNDQKIVYFPYRSGLPVTSVRRIGVISVNNRVAQDAELTIKFI